MKHKKFFDGPIMILAMICIFSSCQKKDNNSPAPVIPLMNVLSNDTTLSYFYRIILRANDLNLFSPSDSITVFAPVNAAFRAVGISTSRIDSLSAVILDSMVRYHYTLGAINPHAASYSSFTSLIGLPVFGSSNGGTVYFNGAAAVKQGLATTAPATLYKLNLPLQVPSASLTGYLANDSTITLFTEALQRTGLATSLGAFGFSTVLIPDNKAFNAAGYPNITSIDAANITTLTNLIKYHILNGQYFTNNFDQPTVTSSGGGTISVTTGGLLPQFTGTNNTAAASMISANKIAGSNIIIHKINTVLMP